MCVPAYSLSVSYGSGSTDPVGLWDLDIDYFRTKVRVHRSKHTTEMDDRESRYFEGMRTLLDIFDYLYRYVFDYIDDVSMIVDPDNEKSVITTDFTFYGIRFIGTLSYKITADNPLGVFKVSAAPKDDDRPPERMLTVSADQVLCYTENFPAPSVLINCLTAALEAML